MIPKLVLTVFFNADKCILPATECHQAWQPIRRMIAAAFYVLVELGGTWIHGDNVRSQYALYQHIKINTFISKCMSYLLSSHREDLYPSKSTLGTSWLEMCSAANANFRHKTNQVCQPYRPGPGDYSLVILFPRLCKTHLKYKFSITQ